MACPSFKSVGLEQDQQSRFQTSHLFNIFQLASNKLFVLLSANLLTFKRTDANCNVLLSACKGDQQQWVLHGGTRVLFESLWILHIYGVIEAVWSKISKVTARDIEKHEQLSVDYGLSAAASQGVAS